MKIIKYKILSCEINHGTEDEPNIEQVFLDKVITCPNASLEANLALAKREAYGEPMVEDNGQPEPEQPSETSVWDELDAAYQEGVDSV